ncbi:MAG: hypothetical protein M3Q34_00720 [bacterium]|nr:hypothetical protein [bacterium]
MIEIPDVQINKAFETWGKSKAKIYGPDWYLENESKKMILEKVLRGQVPDNVLDKELARLS